MRPSVWDFVWLALVCALATAPFILLAVLGSPGEAHQPRPIALSELASAVERSSVRSIDIDGNQGVMTDRYGNSYTFELGPHTNLLHALAELGVTSEQLAAVNYSVRDPPLLAVVWQEFAPLLPMVLIGTMAVLALRAGSDASTQQLQFTRHRARRVIGTAQSIGFADLAGVDEAKQELQEIVQFLSAPNRFADVGARCPRGVLLVGPPGTGKTLLARAVAGEARVPFFTISGSAFIEIIAGVGASRVRDLFEEAKRCCPCILFVDEIDAIGRRRGLGVSAGRSETEQTLNQLLVEMDGFDSGSQIVVMAATNRVDILDPALLRPGRFDRQVVVPPPNRAERQAILRVHARKKPLDPTVDLALVAGATTGCSGADLATIMNEAAILAGRRGKRLIGMAELDDAIERQSVGPECSSRTVPLETKTRLALREAGRALAMHVLDCHPAVHKISIVPHGQAAAFTRSVGSDDHMFMTRAELEARLTASLAGAVAERLTCSEVASGAEADIRAATQIAEAMIRRYGMSQRLGSMALPSTTPRIYSEATARLVDDEVRSLIDAGCAHAAAILNEHAPAFERLAAALLEREVLEGDDLQRLLP